MIKKFLHKGQHNSLHVLLLLTRCVRHWNVQIIRSMKAHYFDFNLQFPFEISSYKAGRGIHKNLTKQTAQGTACW